MTKTAYAPYDTWETERGYLRGLRTGVFSQAPEVRELVEAAPAVFELRYRGERLTVHDTAGGVFAVLEGFFGPLTSTYARFGSTAAARAWCCNLGTQWLRNDLGRPSRPVDGFSAWSSGAWAVERDRGNSRWYVTAGAGPGCMMRHTQTADPGEGWAFVARVLEGAGVGEEQWPEAMRRARADDIPPQPVCEPAPAPLGWWERLVAAVRAVLQRA